MLSMTVWNLSDFWKGVEKASLYLMMFLAVAVLFLPLVQPKEAEAAIPALVKIGITAVVTIGGIILGSQLAKNKCSACEREVAQAESHWTTCGTCGAGYYTCRERHRIYCNEHHQWRKVCVHDCTPSNSN